MKKLFLIAAAGLLFTAAGNAQVQRKAPSQAMQSDSLHNRHGKRLMEQMNLTTEQKAQMKEIHQSNRQQFEAIKNDKSLTDVQRKQKIKELRIDQKNKMDKILTPDQKQKMDAYRQSMKDKKGHKNFRHMQKNKPSDQSAG